MGVLLRLFFIAFLVRSLHARTEKQQQLDAEKQAA
jgi:hypothetical protein